MNAITPSAWQCFASKANGFLVAALLVALPTTARAHAFIIHSEPRGGATLAEAPARVRIWFDGPIESMFAMIRVDDRNKLRVDNGDGRVNRSDNTLLEVGLPPLPPGRYRVFWSVVARDGHRREGNFSFLVK